MILSGFYKESNEKGYTELLYSEWKLVGETIGIICNNFIRRVFNVVIGGYLDTKAWEELEKN